MPRPNPIVVTVLFVTTLVFMRPLAQASLATHPALPDSTENIHVGLIFDYREPDLTRLQDQVDYVWGGSPKLKGPSLPYVDYYIPFSRDGNSSHTLAYWNNSHPDWVLYQCDQKTPAYLFGNRTNIPLDITNPLVRDYQLQIAEEKLSVAAAPGRSFNGIAWDNMSLSNVGKACGVWQGNTWVGRFTGGSPDPAYTRAIVTWAQDIYTRMKERFPDKGIAINYDGGVGADDPLMPYLDINLSESGFTGFSKKMLADAAWTAYVQRLEKLDELGKGFVVINEFAAADDQAITQAQVQWALSNYLLVKGRHSYVSITAYTPPTSTSSGVQHYGYFYDRPEYHASIGSPISARYFDRGVQRRNYSNGVVFVNPSSRETFQFTLTRSYIDLYGNEVATLVLPPTTGIVLLRAPVSRRLNDF